MPNKCYFVATHGCEGQRNSGVGYTTVDEALMAASDLLNTGVVGVRIVDNEGALILPPDQVLLRLNPTSRQVSKAWMHNR